MSSTGQLAAVLRATTDDALVHGLNLRSVTVSGNSLNSIRDFFDLSDALLSNDSLQNCLTRLDRRSLTALVQISDSGTVTGEVGAEGGAERPTDHDIDASVLANLHDHFLVHDTTQGITVWPEVMTQLARWPVLGLSETWADDPEPGTTAHDESSHVTDALAPERAFASTTAMGELLFELEREPVRMLTTGLLGRPSARRLAELLRVDEAEVASYVGIAEHAGLVQRSAANLVPSDVHRGWLEHGPAERWVVIAEAWVNANWSEIRTRIAQRHFAQSSSITAWLQWNYPGGRRWLPQQCTTTLAEADMLGLTAHGTISSLGAKLLSGETEEAANQLTAGLPTPVDRLYLQHDLTAVATGPLDPRIDTRLRTMADVDGHTIASRYRFTSASITRAISDRESAASILEFLASITLSGIPQPLDYLVNETASRHGLLRVGPLPSGDPHAVAYIRSDDHMLLRTVLIDRNLSALRLRPRDSEYIVSTCERDQLYASLYEAKYPVAIEDAHGRILATRPQRAPGGFARTPAVKTRPDPHRTLVSRIRIADADAPDDSDEAWLARQLDSAIRSKSTVTVSVRMPNGNVVDYQLEPASVSGGRLRARDPQSEIERTLPLSSIAGVRGI